MNFNKQNFEKVLNDKLIGLETQTPERTFERAANQVLDYFAKEEGFEQFAFYTEPAQWSRNAVLLTYHGHSFCAVSFHKKRGRYNHGYWWTISSIEVLYEKNDSLKEIAKRIEDNLDKAKQAKKAKLEKAKEIYRLIKQTLGTEKDYDVTDFICFMSDNRFDLKD